METFKVENISSLKLYNFFSGKDLYVEVLNKIKNLDIVNNVGNSNGADRLNRLSEFSDLHNWFQECLDTIFLDLKLPKSFKKLNLTESWFNKSSRGEWHHLHKHPNSYISGIYYLNTMSSAHTVLKSKNLWYSDFPLFEVFENMGTNFEYNSFSVKPEAGKLILFPSALQHSVDENLSDTDRYTIAFNSYPDFKHEEDGVFLNLKVMSYDE
jgi:uncharacterized protein (TIGR02466 family)